MTEEMKKIATIPLSHFYAELDDGITPHRLLRESPKSFKTWVRHQPLYAPTAEGERLRALRLRKKAWWARLRRWTGTSGMTCSTRGEEDAEWR